MDKFLINLNIMLKSHSIFINIELHISKLEDLNFINAKILIRYTIFRERGYNHTQDFIRIVIILNNAYYPILTCYKINI